MKQPIQIQHSPNRTQKCSTKTPEENIKGYNEKTLKINQGQSETCKPSDREDKGKAKPFKQK